MIAPVRILRALTLLITFRPIGLPLPTRTVIRGLHRVLVGLVQLRRFDPCGLGIADPMVARVVVPPPRPDGEPRDGTTCPQETDAVGQELHEVRAQSNEIPGTQRSGREHGKHAEHQPSSNSRRQAVPSGRPVRLVASPEDEHRSHHG